MVHTQDADVGGRRLVSNRVPWVLCYHEEVPNERGICTTHAEDPVGEILMDYISYITFLLDVT